MEANVRAALRVASWLGERVKSIIVRLGIVSFVDIPQIGMDFTFFRSVRLSVYIP